MKQALILLLGGAAIAGTAAAGQMSETAQKPKPPKASQAVAVAATDRGQAVFKQNCYRCHQEPQGFPASISGSVAKHMRVRAGLSDGDYQALMKFLNP